MKLVIHTDGGSRGNPGPSALGIVVFDELQTKVFESGAYLGQATNNEAEYQAFIASAEWLVASTLPIEQVTWKLDSALVVNQLNKLWQIKEPRMRSLAEQAWKILARLPYSYSIVAVRREQNQAADAMVNQTLDAHLS